MRILCGDWKRCVTPAVTTAIGRTGVFLDPPYIDDGSRVSDLYTQDSGSVAKECEQWCLENGENDQLYIALCGFEGQYDLPKNWLQVNWVANGGYGNRSKGGNRNKYREMIWFSPACDSNRLSLFEGDWGSGDLSDPLGGGA